MTKPPPEELASFLARQPGEVLVELLLELARDHDEVRARLARLQLADQPDKLAAGFRKTLNAWKRSTRFYAYREAGTFGRTLEGWLDQVERELLPRNPSAALELFQAFIAADACWFERADDSGGVIGDAVRSACRHWLRAAARCETPPGGWPDRVLELYLADHYGARGALLRDAGLLLDEAAQRVLATRFDARLAAVLESSATLEDLPIEVFRISGALSLLAESLRDPDVMVRGTLRYSPDPNSLQRESFARAYLDADRPADALVWLQHSESHPEDNRLALLAEALEKLGRFDESVPIRQRMFERTLSEPELERWLEHLPTSAHPAALARARECALAHPARVAAARLLLRLGDPVAAEAQLLGEPGRVGGSLYGNLGPLTQALREHDCPRGETVLYRALLQSVLDRAQTRAYGHAARYWSRLREIARGTTSLAPLPSHDAFEAEIRAQHGRKTAFWSKVNVSRRG
jgi:hypothetical protein